jgi:general secretion pathway protein D
VVNGPASYIEEIAKVIEQTDFRRKQVLVDAIIVEVSDDFAREIGVQWKTAFTDTTSGVVASSNFGLVTMDTDGNAILGQGLSLGFMEAGDLRLLLKAVAVNVDANILSRPSIVTLDNQEAEILVGQNIPLITGQSTGAAATTENPFTTVERKDIGITLKVTPQINEGDAITLDVIQEVENVSASASSEATDIVTNKRSVKTKVLVRDQDVLVLGGLIDTTDQTTVKKVPLLGDIPLVGNLFRTTQTEKLRRNLMVFIRPTILADAESASRVSQERYDTTRDSQQSYYQSPKDRPEPVILPEFESITPNAARAPEASSN